MFPKKVELQALMKYYDTNQDGTISYSEFTNGLRDELPPRRSNIINKAFATMDPAGSGSTSQETLRARFDVSKNPDYLERGFSKEQILDNFCRDFGAEITLDQFRSFYSDLSMSIASDEYFVRMMEATWACWEDDEDAAQCDKTVRQLLGELRSRVKKQAGGDSARLRKQFVDYDINASGAITIDECTTMLQKLGISVERKWVHPMFRAIDRDNSGSIEFEEFEAFVNDN